MTSHSGYKNLLVQDERPVQKSEWLWVNQNNVLTADKKLADVARVHLPVLLRSLTDAPFLLFVWNPFCLLGLGRPTVSYMSRPIGAAFWRLFGLVGFFLGFLLLHNPVGSWVLEAQLLKELDKDLGHISIK